MSLVLTIISTTANALDREAERFVTLALSLARVHPEEIDGYFGPARLDVRSVAGTTTLSDVRRDAQQLLAQLRTSTDTSTRKLKLQKQVEAFSGLLDVIERPRAYSFDAETRRVYGMALAPPDAARSARSLQALERLLPGSGSLATRVAAFRDRFVVPPDRRRAVFERALAECRARTLKKWALPADERLTVEWTREVDAAWHRYDGHFRSTLRLNPAAVAYLSSATDVACHEGYPGHHAQFVVMEVQAGKAGIPVEDTVVLLRSPISMLREGAANFGVQLAFPPAERLAFERDVLFPLAGFDSAQAAKYTEVNRLIDELSANVAPIVRDYRDGRVQSEAARRALESAALISSPDSLLRFVDQLGAYVLGYTAARDKVRVFIEKHSEEDAWSVLRTVLSRADVTPLRDGANP